MSVALEQAVREQFERDVAEHRMEVLRDDGLYRHLRFRAPSTWSFSFSIVTWPGYLYVGGDVDDYVFARISDMFEFFGDGTKYSHGINPHYWAQKLQGPRRGRDLSRSYSHDAFRARLLEWARIQFEEYEWDEEMYPSLLIGALEREVLASHTFHEEEARELLDDLATYHDLPVGRDETWEWDLTEYDRSYLWICWAIVWGIERYQAANSADMQPQLTLTRDDQERLGAIATLLELEGLDRDGRESRFLRQLRDHGKSK